MIQHMTPAVRAAMENHSRQDEEPQQSSMNDDHSQSQPSERPASKIVISTEVSSQARTYIASRNANHHNEPVGLISISTTNLGRRFAFSDLANSRCLTKQFRVE
jgi:hypothetical protein